MRNFMNLGFPDCFASTCCKHGIMFAVLLLLATTVPAQTLSNVESGGHAPNILNSASNQLLSVPIMMQSEREAIEIGEGRRMVFQLDGERGYWHYDGKQWKAISGQESGKWKSVSSGPSAWNLIDLQGNQYAIDRNSSQFVQRSRQGDGGFSYDFEMRTPFREGFENQIIERIKGMHSDLNILQVNGKKVHAEFGYAVDAGQLSSFFNLLGFYVVEPNN